MKKQLVVCGGGSSAHTLIPMLADSAFDVSVFTSKPDRWSHYVELEHHDPSGKVLGRYAGSLKKALAETENASERDVYLVCGSLSLMQLF